MSRWFALKGEVSGELISYRGAVLVHDSEADLRRLFPYNPLHNRTIVVPVDIPSLGRRVMKFNEHPEWNKR